MMTKEKKITTKNWYVHVDNTVISKLVETKTNSKCWIRYSDNTKP